MKQVCGGLESGPLVLFDEAGNVLIVSPFNEFMAASYWHHTQEKTINWGIMGGVNDVPAGFSYSTMIYHGTEGINKVRSPSFYLVLVGKSFS